MHLSSQNRQRLFLTRIFVVALRNCDVETIAEWNFDRLGEKNSKTWSLYCYFRTIPKRSICTLNSITEAIRRSPRDATHNNRAVCIEGGRSNFWENLRWTCYRVIRSILINLARRFVSSGCNRSVLVALPVFFCLIIGKREQLIYLAADRQGIDRVLPRIRRSAYSDRSPRGSAVIFLAVHSDMKNYPTLVTIIPITHDRESLSRIDRN